MARVTRVVLICEGWRDSAFARGFLAAANVPGKSVDSQQSPGGSAYTWVRKQFVTEVRNLLKYSEGRGVLALIDEDGAGAQARQNQIESDLQERGLPPVSATAGRCLLLPVRNLETWLCWLTAHQKGVSIQVDEATDYKHGCPSNGISRIENPDCRPAGAHLHTLDHTKMPAGHPPALGTSLRLLREFVHALRR